MKTTAFFPPRLLACLLTFAFTAGLQARDEEKRGGTVEGILVAKDKNSITVLPERAEEPMRFHPHWRGGAPKDGGGLDKAMLDTIRSLIVTNRVAVKWEYEERPRVVEVKTLLPQKKRGTVRGVIVAKGEHFIDVKPSDGKAPTERYLPHWSGGNPSQGGGLDKEILSVIREAKVGQEVTIRWEYDERKRLLGLR